MDSIRMREGETLLVKKPETFSNRISWRTGFLKYDGSLLRNAGYYKIKRELMVGEEEGERKAEETKADHLMEIEVTSGQEAYIKAKNKGNAVVVARDDTGKEKIWKVEIVHENQESLPHVLEEDFQQIRVRWKRLLTGKGLKDTEEGGQLLNQIHKEAEKVWNQYIYRGQPICEDIPWKENRGKQHQIPYTDDAIQFTSAFQKVQILCKAYGAEGGQLYKKRELLQDIIHILDFLCGRCYVAKTQTENWWTWEIGIPKALIPSLVILYESLTKEQIWKYTEGITFFQPDPFHEGAVGSASTHGKGYREGQGANIIDCATIAVGLGALREDNELVYLGMLASAETFVIKYARNGEEISIKGYESGFYEDGSYLDHIKVPYLGAYGIEFMKGAAKIPYLLHETKWNYPDSVWKKMETYVIQGFGNAIYKGCMLDCLKGRSVSRPSWNNREIGREAMKISIRLLDFLGEKSRNKVLPMLKEWMEEDKEFLESLNQVEDVEIKDRAHKILRDASVISYVPPIHKSYPLMDRVIHRRKEYLFVVSMYSERIQNTEIMNHENRFGWHQNNGMTYLYDADNQYTENFWNTVNPLRLAGTTIVPVNIGNGKPDSSGYAQGGDFCSKESWVGGTAIGNLGVSGMSFSGEIQTVVGDPIVTYAPDLKGKKSWFMFDEEIVCLGTGITNKNMDMCVETIVENKKLRKDGSNRFFVNGEKADVYVRKADVKELVHGNQTKSGTSFTSVNWAYLEGNQSVGTGYYFPKENTEVQVCRGETTGDWKDIGTFEGKSTENYLEMWFDHGKNPENESYSYVLLPEIKIEEMKKYVKDPQIIILENSRKLQAVYHKKLKTIGINFWQTCGGSIAGVTSDGAASVMLQETVSGTWKISVSDPTMRNNRSIKIALDKKIENIVGIDENVFCENGKALCFDMTEKNGDSSLAELQISYI